MNRVENTLRSPSPAGENLHRVVNLSVQNDVSSGPHDQPFSRMDTKESGDDESESRGSHLGLKKRRARLVDRESVFHQSKGRWNIRRIRVPNFSSKLYLLDPFHSIVHMGTPKVLLLLASCYLVTIMVFAGMYLAVHDSCKLEIRNYRQAFYFSLETIITIGYGAQGGDVFFNDCLAPMIIITFQSLAGILLDALAIGIVFQRFARAQSRANTVIFSSTACIRRIRGHLYFLLQVCEMRKHQLIEAHVRMYAIRRGRYNAQDPFTVTNGVFQSYPMRLQHPDDELGALLLLSLPSVVVHRIDKWSPLLPPSNYQIRDGQPVYTQSTITCCNLHNPSSSYLYPDVLQRQADAESGNRDAARSSITDPPQFIPNCGCEEHPVEENARMHRSECDRIMKYWEETQLEVVVLIEGIDAATSSTIQARHSYHSNSDIVFDSTFRPCVSEDEEGAAVVDFTRFHETIPLDFECLTVRESYC